ncbi:hypothetical protein HD554DRAFT_2203035 [Boletus coccyginus]|nr:hypothetical protein HD554DRAFT_2203035 [Boletus coccyginus]
MHQVVSPPDDSANYLQGQFDCDGGQSCDANGQFLLSGTPHEPWPLKSQDDWQPFHSCMPAIQINKLLDIWMASLLQVDSEPLLTDHKHLYKTIDNSKLVYFHHPQEVVGHMLANPDFTNEINLVPYWKYDSETNEYRWCDDIIAQDVDTHRSVFVPLILGSNKMTVSVATGQNDYYPLYLLIGNICNNVRDVHRHALVLIAFLAQPKNGHYHHVVFGLGPYIADYEEQVLLSCIIRGWCLADCCDLDKDGALFCCCEHTKMLVRSFTHTDLWDDYGAFKDHLVNWVENNIVQTYKGEADAILDEINQRSIYIPAIEGYVPQDMICALWDFLKFCYLPNVVTSFNLPRQHSMKHYPEMIQLFGAPNGLCSSITESKYIKAVKQPYHCSNCHNALDQMLVMNQCLDKLVACCVDFQRCGMLSDFCVSDMLKISELSNELRIPQLQDMIQQFLYHTKNPDDSRDLADIPLAECPWYDGKVKVFNSTSTTFYTPSDISGIYGMKCKIIHCSPSWRNRPARQDCAFVTTDPTLPGMRELDVVRIFAFFSFVHLESYYPCAVICWFVRRNEPDEDTGMWIIRPGFNLHCQHDISIIHLDTMYHTAHLIPIYCGQEVPLDLQPDQSYDKFHAYYINKYADHHTFKIAS